MDDKAIAFAIPFFFVAILVELLWNRSRGDARYRFHDSIASLACGVGQIMVDASFRFVTFGGYVFAWRHFRAATISETSVLAWIAVIVGADLCYYAFHRASHRVNVLWAMHAVHHQSEEYNLSTALRQSWFDPLVQWTFYLPLAIAGFTPAMYAMAATINLLYQFFLHTRAVDRLGPLEWILNTPSHHRVHHGIDPEYIDKNYGGIFIVWDRLFGTFTREEREPTYGTVKPLASWNAAWANVAEYGRIMTLARGATRFSEGLRAWVAPPEWRPQALGGVAVVPPVDLASYRKWETSVPRARDLYVGASFVAAAIATTLLLYHADAMPHPEVALFAAGILASVPGWGAMMEGKGWAPRYELTRWLVTAVVIGVLSWRGVVGGPFAVLVGAAAATFGLWSARLGRGLEAAPLTSGSARVP